jgi:hypothetical protein
MPVELQIQIYPEELITSENFDDLLLKKTHNLIRITVKTRITAKE